MIHRDFASAGVGIEVRDRLVNATRRWKDHQIDDETYLTGVREAYEVGLTKWTVKGNIAAALRHLGTDVTSICYSNAARCQYPEIEPKVKKSEAGRIKRALVTLCLSAFPIEHLAARIKASVVLFTNVAAYFLAVNRLPADIVAVSVHQRMAPGTAPLVRRLSINEMVFEADTRVDSWSSPVREHLRRHTVPGG